MVGNCHGVLVLQVDNQSEPEMSLLDIKSLRFFLIDIGVHGSF